jgi:hypothetical protein
VRQELLDDRFGEKEAEEAAARAVPGVSEFWDEFMRTYVEVNNKPSEVAMKKSIFRHHIAPLIACVALDRGRARKSSPSKLS